jgi:hypothetical protein
MIKRTGNTFQIDLDESLNNPKLKPFIDQDTSVYEQEFISESQAYQFRQDKNKPQEIIPINEATRKEILKEAEFKRKLRAKKLTCRYCGVTSARGWIKFQTNSQYTPGIKYTQYIKLAEAKDMKYFKEFKPREIIRLFLNGDLQVWCSCPDHKYRQKYLAWNLGFGLFKETRFPKKTNPNLEGGICKHLIAVLNILMMNHMAIERDMLKSKFFKRKSQDEEYMKELKAKQAEKKSKSKSKPS